MKRVNWFLSHFSGQDEIFKGSHSSNFYSNRNSAGLDDDEDFKQTTSNAKKSRQRQRGRVQYRNPVPSTSSPPPIALSSTHNIKLTVFNASQSTNRPSFVSSTTPAPFRFTFTPSIQPNRPNELLNLSPIGPLQKQYQQPNYNTTPSVLSQPVVSVPTPFNTNHKPSNTFNAKHFNVPQLPSTQVPPFSQKTNRPFDNNNPINNYQTSSPFAHQSQSKFNHNQLVGVAIGNNFQFNRTAQALPSTNNATNFHQTNFGTPNFPQNFQPNLQRAPTTTSTTTTTLKPPTFNQQDYLLNYRQEQQQRQKAPQFGSSVDTQARIEQQRRLHYDINDYLTASKNDVQGQYSPTSEQYRSIQTFPTHPSIDRNSGDNFTPKYIQSFPSAATPTTPSTTTTTRQQYEPYKQYHEMMRQQQQQQQRTSFNNQSQRPSNVATPTKTPSFNANTNQNNVVNTASTKKFSTLVPKQFYAPTTFKPFYFNVAKQINENLSSSTTMATTTARTVPNASPPQRQASNFNQPIAQARPQFIQSTPKSVIVEGIDEDDGQYHPELYEKDFARYKIKNRKKTQQTQQPQFSQVNQFNRNLQPQTQRGSAFHIAALSNEEEFLSTAHSQNIAASGNELRNAAKQSALKQTSNGVAKPNGNQSTSHAKPTTTKPSTTKPSTSKPSSATRSSKNQHNDDDTSYDYAYYDTGSSHVQSDYNEYDVSDFGKAKKAKNWTNPIDCRIWLSILPLKKTLVLRLPNSNHFRSIHSRTRWRDASIQFLGQLLSFLLIFLFLCTTFCVYISKQIVVERAVRKQFMRQIVFAEIVFFFAFVDKFLLYLNVFGLFSIKYFFYRKKKIRN